MNEMNKPVALLGCAKYELSELREKIDALLEAIALPEDFFAGKNVVIKPNFVSPRQPDKAATTHPVMLRAVIDAILRKKPASLTVAESGGGPYTGSTLKNVYRVCRADEAVEGSGAILNEDTSYGPLSNPDGAVCHEWNAITPILKADVVVDLCKLKTHSLTKMTCATKNFFGVVPGIQKFEMHARFPEQERFQEMILDLATAVTKKAAVVAICDAVCIMEGNGPSNGTPRMMGALLASESPFCLDVVAEHLLGFDGTVTLCDKAAKRGLAPRRISEITLLGESAEPYRLTDCKEPEAKSGRLLKNLSSIGGGKLARALEPRPLINKDACVGCGKCRESCPVHTIEMIEIGARKQAKINPSKCIRCFCCQELCPFDAVKIKKNLLIRLAH